MKKAEMSLISLGLVILGAAYGMEGWSVPGVCCGAAGFLCAVKNADGRHVREDFPVMCGVDLLMLWMVKAAGLQQTMPLTGFLVLVNTFVCLNAVRREETALMRGMFRAGMIFVLLALCAAPDSASLLESLAVVGTVFLPMPLCTVAVYTVGALKREKGYVRLTGM
ncbi:MAG: hypothetical protein IJJ24_02840 [Solobacterium sp.]|nr:hypothetical protein [Solobacterium sp.]MBR0478013.1 hypothetical protein [Solobacterium sp.]